MRLRYGMSGWVVAAMIAAAPVAQAKRFENAYISFDLPDSWACDLEDDTWVCKPPADANGKVSMIAILAAKIVGPGDSPALYSQHLQEMKKDRPNVQVAQEPHDTLFGRAFWQDASMWNSEVPNFKTRYLARTEGRIAVLVTFSSHRSINAEAISDMIASSVVVNSAYAHSVRDP